MLYNFLRSAINRHLEETWPFIQALSDDVLLKSPYDEGRPLGEVVLHMIRSMEFYLTGLSENEWSPLTYSLEEYSTAESVINLANRVFEKTRRQLSSMSSVDLLQVNNSFSRAASIAELMLEVVEHSIHHRGQLAVYYRLLGIDIPAIQYIV
jgi:uncharacterized damage-inducible protein DinB